MHASIASLVSKWQLKGHYILGPMRQRANSLLNTGFCCHGHLTQFLREGQDLLILVPLGARPGALTGVERPSGPCSGASPEACGPWAPKLRYQVTNILEQRASKVSFPVWGGGEMERSAIEAANPDSSFCFNGVWGDSQPGLQGAGAKRNRGMASVGRGSVDEAMRQPVTYSFSHSLHKHVLITVL